VRHLSILVGKAPSGFHLKAALTFCYTNGFAVSPKETWSLQMFFFPLDIPPVWQPIILSEQVVARPHKQTDELRLAYVAQLPSAEEW